MLFDENISENVSLSKILDCFILEEEKPSIIISFLKDHKKDLRKIFFYSDYSNRLFFLDFIAKMNDREAEDFSKIVDKLYDSEHFGTWENKSFIYLVWQVKRSNLPQHIKNVFNACINYKYSPKHPYSRKAKPSCIEAFDNVFCDVNKDIETIADEINPIDNEIFKKICCSFEYSIFKDRIFQEDLFVLLEPVKQFILLNSLKEYKGSLFYSISGSNFFRQVLSSSNVDVEIKYYIYKYLFLKEHDTGIISNLIIFRSDYKTGRTLLESKTLSQVLMKLELNGIDDFASDVILYFLYNHMESWLFELIDVDRELIENHFNVCDLIERIRRDEKQN